MKKAIGIVLTLMMMGTLLAGCYTHSCQQPQPPMNLKGEG